MPPSDAASDETLATAAAAGSRGAFESLVERYAGRVLSVLESRLDHHAALDLAQEAWIRVFRALPGFRPDAAFRPWLFAIVLNAARDEGRRRRRSRIVYQGEFGAARTPPDPAQRSAIDAALAAVPEPFRTALMLVDVEQLSYQEAATSLGCAAGTVKSRVSRGRTAFRDHWARLSGDPRPRVTAGGTP